MDRFLFITFFSFLFSALPAKDAIDSIKPKVKSQPKCNCSKPPFFVSNVLSANCEAAYCPWFDINFPVDTVKLSFINRKGEKADSLELDCPENPIQAISNELDGGLHLEAGVYAYILELKPVVGERLKYCGIITIIR